MAVHTIKAIQRIPASLQEVWDFFSNPANLQTITPAHMNFRVISQQQGDTIYAGQIIEYKVSPLFGMPLYWMTEITEVKEPDYFADIQRKGPYRLWHHRHYFREIPGGVEMTDLVEYKNPGWIMSPVVNRFLVRPQLQKLFVFRFQQISKIFGAWGNDIPVLEIR